MGKGGASEYSLFPPSEMSETEMVSPLSLEGLPSKRQIQDDGKTMKRSDQTILVRVSTLELYPLLQYYTAQLDARQGVAKRENSREMFAEKRLPTKFSASWC
jgi:hypothetical protein